jgi:hypothetical protein
MADRRIATTRAGLRYALGAMPKVSAKKTEGVWEIRHGRVFSKGRRNKLRAVEDLHYNNPYAYNIERVWFDGRVVFASEQGEVDVDPKKVKVAQEYQIVYAVKLNSKGKVARGAAPKRVRGQFNIYDSVPGMKKYSPIWQFNYVIVPRDYKANTFRSERDCLRSGYEIKRSLVFEN